MLKDVDRSDGENCSSNDSNVFKLGDVEQTEPIWTTKVWYYTAHVVLVWWVGWWQWSTELSRLDNFECTCLAESPSFRSWASMHVNREFGQGCHGFVLQTARVRRFLLRMPERMWPEVCDRQPWGFCVRVEPMDLQVTDPQDPHGLGTKMAKICENHHQRSQRSQQCCQSQLKNAHPHLPEPTRALTVLFLSFASGRLRSCRVHWEPPLDMTSTAALPDDPDDPTWIPSVHHVWRKEVEWTGTAGNGVVFCCRMFFRQIWRYWQLMTFIMYNNLMIKGSLGGETSVLRTFRMSGKELVRERVSERKS